MSKRVFNHPPEEPAGKKYWRSMGQLDDTPEFRQWLEREFPQGASELESNDVSRRAFLRLMAASTALAGLSMSACRRPTKHLVPFTKGVEWSIPGKPLFYTTARPSRQGFQPLVATTHDSRPTKIEGNPLHPLSAGATDLFSQSSVLDLYDVDRSRAFKKGGATATEAEFEADLEKIFADANTKQGAGIAVLVENNPSPTRERLRKEIEARYPKIIWAQYEPLDAVATDIPGLPKGVTVRPDLQHADVIVTLGNDLLGQDGDIALQRAFARRRRVEDGTVMNRLYVIENRYTVTGGMADHRLRVRASRIGAFAGELARALTALNVANLTELAAGFPAGPTEFDAAWIKELAKDLVKSKGKAVVLAGPHQSLAVQTLVHAINQALGAFPRILQTLKSPTRPAASIDALAEAITAKKVQTLFILGGNPVYNAPVDLEFAAKLSTVATKVRLGFYEDETTAAGVTWHVPASHYLESWADGYASDGSQVSVQPMILPLFGGWSELDLLARIAGYSKPTGPELVQATFTANVKPTDFTSAWSKYLHDGFATGTAAASANATFDLGAAAAYLKTQPASVNDQQFEVVFTACPKVDDGRYANNGWVQEIPDPISKITWDNAAWISPATARELGLKKDGEWVRLDVKGRSLEIPVHIAPGHADRSVSIALGYGRTHAGRVGSVRETSESYMLDDDMLSGGFNAYSIRDHSSPFIATGVTVTKLDKKPYRIAITQEHGSLEGRGADLVREQSLADYHHEPAAAKKMGMDAHVPPNRSLYSHPELVNNHQWAMVVDMSACTGCSACMVACQAENNIPIVGKRQVLDGREMHWIRTDRYFASGPDARGEYDQQMDDPEFVSQPMMCQHCEYAPCETVCPVNATVHSDDGLNTMAYNRCIGTRYCANNCPFKVRRFNFFDYNQRKIEKLRTWNVVNEKGTPDTIKLSKNPNVTVRMRGVMEKCTFCVQRIQEAKIASKVSARQDGPAQVPANSFTVACAQACPTEAIVFGDKNLADSNVSKLMARERGYRLLEYLNLNQRVTYLARMKNPNPSMPGPKPGEYIKQHHHEDDAHGAPAPHATSKPAHG